MKSHAQQAGPAHVARIRPATAGRAVGLRTAMAFSMTLMGAATGQVHAQSATLAPPSVDGNVQCRAGAVPDYENVQSLENIFGAVARGVGGQIIRAELKQRDFQQLCVWVYEVKVLARSGEVTMAIYDAADLRLIGFNTGASPGVGPVVRVPVVGADSTRKSLQEPDGDGTADSGRNEGSESGVDAADGDSSADASAASADAGTSADSADSGQRGGDVGAKGGGTSGSSDAGGTSSSGDSGTSGSGDSGGATGDNTGSSAAQ